jgi:putative transposase
VDTEGLLIVVQVTAASVQDHHQAFALLAAGQARTRRLRKVWVDEGYQGNAVRDRIAQVLGIELEIVPRPLGQQGFQVLPRRWVVERTIAWAGRYRRLSKDYEFYPETSEALFYLAMTNRMVHWLAKKRAG